MLRLLLLVLTLLLVASCAPSAGPGAQRPTPGESFGATATELLNAVNAERARGATCGNVRYPAAPRLRLEPRLIRTAELHTADMQRNRFLGHAGSDGSTIGQRVTRQGYEWWAVGENVAMGYRTVPEVVTGWMESDSHCSAIMEPSFVELGAAEESHFWTLVFGQPR